MVMGMFPRKRTGATTGVSFTSVPIAANFRHMTSEQATFRGPEFHGEADFRDIGPTGAPNLRHCGYEDLHVRPDYSRTPYDGLVALDHSDFPKATLKPPTDARAIYDLREPRSETSRSTAIPAF